MCVLGRSVFVGIVQVQIIYFDLRVWCHEQRIPFDSLMKIQVVCVCGQSWYSESVVVCTAFVALRQMHFTENGPSSLVHSRSSDRSK